MGAALRRPLADVVVLRRERGRSGVFVDVFVSLSERSPAVIEALGGRVMTRAGSLFGARVPLSALRALGADSRVRYVKAARHLDADPGDFLVSRHCFNCNAELTTPESVALGFGPECRKKFGL